MKKLIRSFSYAICMLLMCNGCGHKEDVKAVTMINTIDSLNVEYDKARNLVDYYNLMQNLSGGILENSGMWWAYRDSVYININKMIEINNEIMCVRNSR